MEAQNIPGKGNSRCEDLEGGSGKWEERQGNCGQERAKRSEVLGDHGGGGLQCQMELPRLWQLVWTLFACHSKWPVRRMEKVRNMGVQGWGVVGGLVY